jgi:ADP-ribose pyrophosphatase
MRKRKETIVDQSETAGRINVFTYGSLMLSFVFQHVTGRCPASIEATLDDWRRVRVDRETFPAAVPANGDQIRGILWRGLSAQEIARLDQFEGGHYQRVSVQVRDCSGENHAAEVYQWSRADGLINEPWDFDWFKTVGIKDFSSKYL